MAPWSGFSGLLPACAPHWRGLALHHRGIGPGRDMGSALLSLPPALRLSGGSSYSPPAYTPPAVYQPSPANCNGKSWRCSSRNGAIPRGKYTEALRYTNSPSSFA